LTKVLVTGGSGLLGKAFIYENIGRFTIFATYLKNKFDLDGSHFLKLDLRNKELIRSTIISVSPDVIIHTAALTNVDLCEQNKELAFEINVTGTKNIVEASKLINVKLIYISSDFVFNGAKEYYTEEDQPNPMNFYGFTKLKGEEFVSSYPNSLIIRTSIYGWNPVGGKKGIEGIIELLNKGKQIYVPYNQYSSIMSVNALAGFIYLLILQNATGIYNVGIREKVDKLTFMRSIAKLSGCSGELIKGIDFEEYIKEKIAIRPKDTSLDVSKVERVLGLKMPLMENDINKLFSEREEYFSFFKGKKV